MTVSISVNIESNGNAAFEDGPATEVGRILREVAEKIEAGDFPEGTTPLFDINGNRCGSYSLSDDAE